MDVKKLGRIPDGGGWKALGRPTESILRDRQTKVGFDYLQFGARGTTPRRDLRLPGPSGGQVRNRLA